MLQWRMLNNNKHLSVWINFGQFNLWICANNYIFLQALSWLWLYIYSPVFTYVCVLIHRSVPIYSSLFMYHLRNCMSSQNQNKVQQLSRAGPFYVPQFHFHVEKWFANGHMFVDKWIPAVKCIDLGLCHCTKMPVLCVHRRTKQTFCTYITLCIIHFIMKHNISIHILFVYMLLFIYIFSSM